MQITIKNFKAIDRDTTIRTGSLNIITGQNSAGKSSITQAIRLLKNNLKKGENGKWRTDSLDSLDLNSLNLGRFRNVVNQNAKEPYFRYTLKIADYNEFLIDNEGFLVHLSYKEGKQEEVAELAELIISSYTKKSEHQIISISLLDTVNPKISVNYDYLVQYFSDISQKSKLARIFNELSKKNKAGFDPKHSGFYKNQHPDFIGHLQTSFPEFPNIEEVVDISDYEQAGYHQLRYKGGRLTFSVLRPETEIKLMTKKGFNTIGKYPVCEFLNDKANKPIKTLFEENKQSVPDIRGELLDLLINMTRDEVLRLFRDREKTIVAQVFSKSFAKLPDAWKIKLRIEQKNINCGDILDQYVLENLNAGNQISGLYNAFNPSQEKEPIKAFVDYLNHLISNVISYISVELDLYDYFNGTNIEINRTYSFSSGSSALNLLNQVRPWLATKHDPRVEFVEKWLKEFGLADHVKVELNEWGDSLQLLISKNNNWVNIATEGTGKAKLLFLILKIADTFAYEIVKAPDFYIGDLAETQNGYHIPKLLILEEPEVFLHPNFQSKLAEMFMDASGYGDSADPVMMPDGFHTSFVIETHSEYLIRKLQYLVAKNKRSKEMANHVIIYYLKNSETTNKNEQRIRRLEVRPDGMLKQDFGEGFFDESTRLTIDLLKLQNNN